MGNSGARSPAELTCAGALFQDVRMKYTVVIKASDEGYSIACPALPGCWSQGKTEEEAVANIVEAIQDYQAAVLDTFKNEQYREIEIAI